MESGDKLRLKCQFKKVRFKRVFESCDTVSRPQELVWLMSFLYQHSQSVSRMPQCTWAPVTSTLWMLLIVSSRLWPSSMITTLPWSRMPHDSLVDLCSNVLYGRTTSCNQHAWYQMHICGCKLHGIITECFTRHIHTVKHILHLNRLKWHGRKSWCRDPAAHLQLQWCNHKIVPQQY